MELLLADQAVEVARVAKAAMEAEAPKAVEKLKSYTKALEATTAQLEARISAALREVSAKVEAEEGLLAEDVLQAAPTCASDGSRFRAFILHAFGKRESALVRLHRNSCSLPSSSMWLFPSKRSGFSVLADQYSDLISRWDTGHYQVQQAKLSFR